MSGFPCQGLGSIMVSRRHLSSCSRALLLSGADIEQGFQDDAVLVCRSTENEIVCTTQPPYRNPRFPVLPRTVGSQSFNVEIDNIHPTMAPCVALHFVPLGTVPRQ